MKPTLYAALAICAVSFVLLVGSSADVRARPNEKAAAEDDATTAQLEREKQFKEALTNVTLEGLWRLVKDGKLGDEQGEKYTISSVTKLGKLWFITARIEYGNKDVTVPVPVRVNWAGDTPVISITEAGLKGLGTYSARVMIYGGLYTGTWSGKGYGGFLSGRIVKNAKSSK